MVLRTTNKRPVLMGTSPRARLNQLGGKSIEDLSASELEEYKRLSTHVKEIEKQNAIDNQKTLQNRRDRKRKARIEYCTSGNTGIRFYRFLKECESQNLIAGSRNQLGDEKKFIDKIDEFNLKKLFK